MIKIVMISIPAASTRTDHTAPPQSDSSQPQKSAQAETEASQYEESDPPRIVKGPNKSRASRAERATADRQHQYTTTD